MDAQRRMIIERLNAFDAGPTEDDRRAERQATIRRAIEAEEDLKWARLSAGSVGGIGGRSVLPLSWDVDEHGIRSVREAGNLNIIVLAALLICLALYDRGSVLSAGCCIRTSQKAPCAHSGQ
jgi:hypothetical protein